MADASISRFLCAATFCTLTFAIAAPAGAQTLGRVALVPVGPVDGPQASQFADDFERALRARRVQIISRHEGRDRLLASSRVASLAQADDLPTIERETEVAIEHLAFGRAAPARRSVELVLARAERAMETLHRDTRIARMVLDACLSLVRADLQRRARQSALEQAMACRRIVPDLAPSESLHPADVVGVVAEADDQLRRMRFGPIAVQSKPTEGCSVYANGRHVGTTPFMLERMAAGEYRIQVECEGIASRVHIVRLVDQPIELVIDTDLDAALDTGSRVELHYRSAESQASQYVPHAAALGKLVRADDVILVEERPNAITLSRVSARQSKLVGRASLSASPSNAEVLQAIDALNEGRILDAAPGGPTTTGEVLVNSESTASGPPVRAALQPVAQGTGPSARPVQNPDVTDHRQLRLWSGASLALAGISLLGVGFGFEVRASRLDDQIASVDASSPEAERLDSQFDQASTLSWTGVAGGALAAAAVPLLARPREYVPWWSLAAGGVGLATAGVGVWQIAIAGNCELPGEDAECFSHEGTERLGALLVSAAAPLLTLPLVHLLRRPRHSLTVSLNATGARDVGIHFAAWH